MTNARERFRTVLSRPDCTLAANIFDPLSARIAHMLDCEICFLSGSVHKVANLAVPDIVLTTSYQTLRLTQSRSLAIPFISELVRRIPDRQATSSNNISKSDRTVVVVPAMVNSLT